MTQHIDVTKLDDSGIFSCPKCGVSFDPAEETEETYTVEDTILEEGNLTALILCCQNCKAKTRLEGFTT